MRVLNRFFDIIFSALLIVIFLPFIAIISLLIFVYDRGSIFADNSIRLGINGKKFFMFKLRSMIPGADTKISDDPKYSDIKEEWSIKRKLPTNIDRRVTPIGKLIRITDFDEIVQLFNVLKGDMSIVGPRPWFEQELISNLKKYPKYKRRMYDIVLKEKPGMTGLWQVSGRNLNTIEQRFELDIYYVKHKSIFLDFFIIFKTPFVILKKIFFGEEYAK